MASSVRRSRCRPAVLLLSGVTAGVVLTGCGAASFRTAEAAAPRPAVAPAASTTDAGSGLADGLLPETAFPDGTRVVRPSAEQVQQGIGMLGSLSSPLGPMAGGGLPGTAEGSPGAAPQVTPQACADAVTQLLPSLAGVTDAAAEAALPADGAAGPVTGEVLARGGDAEALVRALAAAPTTCPQAQLSSPWGSATVTIAELPVPSLADGGAAVQVTVDAVRPDGSALSVPAFLALVRDGDRLLVLAQAAPQGGALDSSAFTGLLDQAVQAEAALD